MLGLLTVLMLNQVSAPVAPAGAPRKPAPWGAAVGLGVGSLALLTGGGTLIGYGMAQGSSAGCRYACELGRSLTVFGGFTVGLLAGLVASPLVMLMVILDSQPAPAPSVSPVVTLGPGLFHVGAQFAF